MERDERLTFPACLSRLIPCCRCIRVLTHYSLSNLPRHAIQTPNINHSVKHPHTEHCTFPESTQQLTSSPPNSGVAKQCAAKTYPSDRYPGSKVRLTAYDKSWAGTPICEVSARIGNHGWRAAFRFRAPKARKANEADPIRLLAGLKMRWNQSPYSPICTGIRAYPPHVTAKEHCLNPPKTVRGPARECLKDMLSLRRPFRALQLKKA